ncbi:uncharacterized protein KY384_003908 [Bacidia gigantensis]|uniref:uncharacterized protein n=1 Tax=Bacidia gigantensis TaxID=2732470 RepID=UPI001D0598CA|nr:uncharacterized protein KY384_003908 [Bacidia gigantensis]KAG8532267.1 hypothetical protein KY384_003908 [Bacidia gigantensis]
MALEPAQYLMLHSTIAASMKSILQPYAVRQPMLSISDEIADHRMLVIANVPSLMPLFSFLSQALQKFRQSMKQKRRGNDLIQDIIPFSKRSPSHAVSEQSTEPEVRGVSPWELSEMEADEKMPPELSSSTDRRPRIVGTSVMQNWYRQEMASEPAGSERQYAASPRWDQQRKENRYKQSRDVDPIGKEIALCKRDLDKLKGMGEKEKLKSGLTVFQEKFNIQVKKAKLEGDEQAKMDEIWRDYNEKFPGENHEVAVFREYEL